jgi:acyl carrier protein
MKRLEDQIKEIIIREVGLEMAPEEIADDEFLLGGGLNLDSVIIIELVLSLEEHFDFVFEDEDISRELFSSVKSVADFIRSKLQ